MILTAASYFLWGILPLYWKAADSVRSEEILAHRVFWSFIFMLLVLTAGKNWRKAGEALIEMKKRPVLIMSLVFSSLFISANWFVYIWAVNNHHILEASLGYYINPLISVLLGVFFLKEKLNKWQKFSFLLAFAGVLISSIHFGSFPWISMILALSFGFYGLTKKVTKLNAAVGLAFETLVVMPAAVLYLLQLMWKGESAFMAGEGFLTDFLLIGAGIVTAVPLLLFSSGAQKIPLYMTGILQYIAPTLTLIVGLVIFKESFTAVDFITFAFIWLALAVFTFSSAKDARNLRMKKAKSKSA
ncbi:EamA family transporter RarD [Bacillus sp. FJAT-42376]|nr:EamA family transporter RarD [Bacillus sp. FJAT-42376]